MCVAENRTQALQRKNISKKETNESTRHSLVHTAGACCSRIRPIGHYSLAVTSNTVAETCGDSGPPLPRVCFLFFKIVKTQAKSVRCQVSGPVHTGRGSRSAANFLVNCFICLQTVWALPFATMCLIIGMMPSARCSAPWGTGLRRGHGVLESVGATVRLLPFSYRFLPLNSKKKRVKILRIKWISNKHMREQKMWFP